MFSDILKKLRKEKRITQLELSEIIGVERSSIGKYESGKAIPSPAVLMALSDFFGVSVNTLLDKNFPDSLHLADSIKIPVYSRLYANLTDSMGYISDYAEISVPSGDESEYFSILIKDVSMEPKLCIGDIAILRKTDSPETGSFISVIVADEATVIRKYTKCQDGMILTPLNHQAGDSVFYTTDEILRLPVRVTGVLVEQRRKY